VDRFAAVTRRQLAVDVLEVCLDGVDGDVHLAGDLRGVQHLRYMHQDLPLAFGEWLNHQNRGLMQGPYGSRRLFVAQGRGEKGRGDVGQLRVKP